jgi:hypothetical protein
MNRAIGIRQILFLSIVVALSITLLLPFDSTKANDDAASFSVFLPYTSGNLGINPPPGPTETVTPSPTTSPTASVTPSVTASPTASVTPSPTDSPTETPTETPTEEPTTEPGDSQAWAFFADPEWNTNSASIATDANGGIHLAFHYYEAANDGAPTMGVYQYCPSDCDKPANWKSVQLGANVSEIQLELTADGRPRILYRVPSEDNGFVFYYAECNQNCTQASGWNGAAIASNEGMAILEFSDHEQPQRYFELDPDGRPRFVYGDYNYSADPDHLGTFYAFCDSGCTAASNWSEVRINKDNGGVGQYRSEDFYYPALAFTPTGQPRVLADGHTMNDESFLHYVACDSACEDPANWQSAPLFERGSGNNVAYDIEINAQGQPRIAYYDGARLNSEGEWLYYGWCNDGCTNAGNWDRFEFGFTAREGQEPDLELDSEGKPHIAYIIYSEGGLAYSHCTSACESASGQWNHTSVESATQLETAWNVAFPPHCDGGLWDGVTPTLALDKDGNPVFSYDSRYYARCWYNDELKVWEPYYRMELVQRTVRTYFLPKE